MSNVKATLKSADQLMISLADHRKFNSGQISYLLREQIEKPKIEENFDRLLRLNENVCVLDDLNREDFCKQYDKCRDQLNDKLTNLVERTEAILKIGETSRAESQCDLDERSLTQQNPLKSKAEASQDEMEKRTSG